MSVSMLLGVPGVTTRSARQFEGENTRTNPLLNGKLLYFIRNYRHEDHRLRSLIIYTTPYAPKEQPPLLGKRYNRRSTGR